MSPAARGRPEAARHGNQVVGLFAGAIDTDMMAGFEVPKADPVQVVRAALDGVAAGDLEVVVDSTAAQAKASLAGGPRERYPQLAAAAPVVVPDPARA